MGSILKGILGGFRGTVGTVVGSSWRGIDYIRSKSASRNSTPSEKQLEQRAKFKMVSDFLNTISGLLKVTFASFAVNQTARNNALDYTLENAVTGIYPNVSLDFSQVLVARGSKLPNASNVAASSAAAGKVTYNWLDNSGIGGATATDKAIMVVHCPELKQTVYNMAGPARNALTGELNVPEFAGKQVHSWLSFITEDGKHVATSLYTGSMNVAA